MSNNALYAIEQVDNKLIITVEAVKQEQPDLPEARPMNADEIEDWVRRCFENNLMPHKLSYFINEAIQYELNKAKR